VTFGKRKLAYSEDADAKLRKEASESVQQISKKTKTIMVPASRVSYMTFKTETKQFFIPVYFERDLAYTPRIQQTLKELVKI
jgi:hypothetical protein